MDNAKCAAAAPQRQLRDRVCDLAVRTATINDMLNTLETRLFGTAAPKDNQAEIGNEPQHLQHGLFIIEENIVQTARKLDEILSQV